jgi:two-component system response regulator WspF
MRIAIVNDLNMAVESLRRVVCSAGKHRLAWIARNGSQAVELCSQDKPDLILMDMIMPVMNGVVATRKIMQSSPCPILIVTASVTDHASMVFEALGAGALDAVVTPVLTGKPQGGSINALLERIDLIGKLSGFRPAKLRRMHSKGKESEGGSQSTPLIAVGCSTGGPAAAVRLLRSFPKNLRAAVVIIQHMDEKFIHGLANWLDQQSPLPVRVPQEGERLQAGHVFVPGTAGHVVLDQAGFLHYTKEPEGYFYHPSVDVFFRSMARNLQCSCVGVVLTGMGRDGGEGLLALKERGFLTIAQDRETCVVYGMPKYATELGAARKVLPLDNIGPEIAGYLAKNDSETVDPPISINL